MNWQTIIKRLKQEGYKGSDNDLAAVKSFIEQNVIELECEGKAIDLDALHAKAYPASRKLDMTTDAKDAEIADLKAKLEVKNAEDEILGKNKGASEAKSVEVKVGKELLADDPKGGFKSLGQFIQAAYRVGGAGERANEPAPDSLLGKWQKAYSRRVMADAEFAFKSGLIEKATLSSYANETTGADGGFAVPPEFRTGIMSRMTGEESIASRCQQATLSGNQLIATIDDTNPWDSSGGVQPYWLGEATAITQSKPVLKDRTFKLRKVGVLVPMTEELAQDASFMESYIGRLAADKISFAVDNAILNGNGVTRPTGVVGHNGTVSVAKETSPATQASTSIVANNVQKMWMRCHPRHRRTAFWIINPDAQVQLQRMFVQGLTDAGTAVAAGSLIYMPANGLSGQPYDTLFGRPILYHQACATLGTVGDIILFDGESYLVCTKASGVDSVSSMHLWFDQAVNALRFLYRVEGQPWWPSTITALNGSTTYGAFVTLATR